MDSKEFTERLKKIVLSHPEKGKLSTYIISNGKLYQEMKSVYEEIENSVLKEMLISQRQ